MTDHDRALPQEMSAREAMEIGMKIAEDHDKALQSMAAAFFEDIPLEKLSKLIHGNKVWLASQIMRAIQEAEVRSPAGNAEPVAWQWLHPDEGWCCLNIPIDKFRGDPEDGHRQVRPLYTHPHSQPDHADVIEKLRAWFKFQSVVNTGNLYNAAAKLFGSDFNPAEYDDVE